MPIILSNTKYDYSRQFHNATADSVAVVSSSWNKTQSKTMVSFQDAGGISSFKKGDKVTIATPSLSFTGTLSSNVGISTSSGNKYFFLDSGINYTNGKTIEGGTLTHAVEAAPVSASKTKKYLIYGGVALVALLLFMKFRKKGKK
jgi:hypothetical protein